MTDPDSPDKPEPFANVTQMVINAGRNIFEQGSPSFQAFYIDEGRVAVTTRDGPHTITLAELGPGEIFGEMGVLQNEMRMATVTALETTTVSVLKRDELEARINSIEDKFVRSLITVLIKRLRAANQGQMNYYRSMAELQNHLMGLAQGVDSGIDSSKRDQFTQEIMPLMAEMEKIVRKYRG